MSGCAFTFPPVALRAIELALGDDAPSRLNSSSSNAGASCSVGRARVERAQAMGGWRWWGPRFAHCGGSAGALARLSAEYAMPGVVGVGLVHCSLSAEMKVMIRS
jgi:uncharacterized membrane-anchored protein